MAQVFRHTCGDCHHPVEYKSAKKGYVHIKEKGDCPLIVTNIAVDRRADR